MSEHSPEMLEMVSVFAAGGIDARTGECAAVREHIAQCAQCREEYRNSVAAAAAIGLSAAQSPPPDLRARVLAALPARVSTLPMRRPVRWYIPAAVAAVLVIAAGVWWKTQLTHERTWALNCMPSAVNCHAQGALKSTGGHLQLQIHGLAMLPPGKQYQAWMIMPGQTPTPEPVFSVAANGDGSVAFAGAPVKGALVAVTVEPMGGSRKPTTKPFLVAQID